jgi:hypothetical protein
VGGLVPSILGAHLLRTLTGADFLVVGDAEEILMSWPPRAAGTNVARRTEPARFGAASAR